MRRAVTPRYADTVRLSNKIYSNRICQSAKPRITDGRKSAVGDLLTYG